MTTRPRTAFYHILMIGLALAPHLAGRAAELRITNVASTAQGVRLGWTNLGAGTSYTIQQRDWLGESLWVMPGNTSWPVPAAEWTDVSALSNRMAFYRVLGVPTAERGKILKVTTNATYTPFQIGLIMAGGGVPITPETTPQYSVRLLKLNYETIGSWGARIKASGVLAIPTGFSGSLPMASYQHGTLSMTNEAPSVNSSSTERFLGVVFASTGYAAVLPDNIGLGESEGIQEYHHARSEATASIDLIRAARKYCASNSIVLNGKLFLCGYSHGGHSTMALLRELETFYTNEFTVTACAPMAGAYDLSGATAADFLSVRLMPNPYYFALLLAAYQDVYHLAPTLADLLRPPYNTTLPPLLNGNTPSGTISLAMTNPPVQILKPELLQAFQTNGNHILLQALRDNDLIYWTPRSPLRMYHCGGDQDVSILNSSNALSSFHARGATQVQLVVPSMTYGHSDCVQPSMLAAKAWFDSLR